MGATTNTLKTCFFGLKAAVIDADTAKTEMYLSFLREYPESEIEEALHPKWLRSFKSIQDNFERGIVREDIEVGEIKAYDYKPKEIPDILEKEVVRRLLTNPKVLIDALEIKEMTRLVPEMPADGDDRVDLFTEDKDETCFPIEAKLGIADHRIVGQIKKYVDFFWRKLSYDFYHTVQGVTVAAGYDQTTMKELKSQGVRVFAYTLVNTTVELTEL